MKVVQPTPLMRDATAALEPVIEDVVVIGAVGVGVALSKDLGSERTDQTKPAQVEQVRDLDLVVPVAPTRDIDLAVERTNAARVVSALTAAGLEPSDAKGERGFTWVRDDLKVQLMTPPSGPRRMGDRLRLPVQPALRLAERHRIQVAFSDSPRTPRFWCATPAALVALKRAAFGRRDHAGNPIERDYHDAFQLIDALAPQLLAELSDTSDGGLRMQVRAAAEQLSEGTHATAAAARERVRLRLGATERDAELQVVRSTRAFLRELGSAAGRA